MRYYVYILYSEKYDIFYKGQTNDLENRFDRHNSGLEQSTSRYKPWFLVWFTKKESRSEAMKLEKKLKNLTKERLLDFINKYS